MPVRTSVMSPPLSLMSDPRVRRGRLYSQTPLTASITNATHRPCTTSTSKAKKTPAVPAVPLPSTPSTLTLALPVPPRPAFPFHLYLTCQDAEAVQVTRLSQTDQWKEEEAVLSFLPSPSTSSQSPHCSDAATSTTEGGDGLFDWSLEADALVSAIVAPLVSQALLEVRFEQRREAMAALEATLARKVAEERSRIEAMEEQARQREVQKRAAIEKARAMRSEREQKAQEAVEAEERRGEAERLESLSQQRKAAELRMAELEEARSFLQQSILQDSARSALDWGSVAMEAVRLQLQRATMSTEQGR